MSLRDVAAEIVGWRDEGRSVAVATVASTWGSAPCPVGSVLAVAAPPPESPDDFPAFAGSVSGGCIEAAVIDAALRVLAGAEPCCLRFGVSDETALAAGLACGGEIEVWVETLNLRPDKRAWLDAALAGQSVARLVLLEPIEGRALGAGRSVRRKDDKPVPFGSLGDPAWDAAADALLGARGIHDLVGARCLLLRDDPPERLIIVGGGHIAQHLAPMARDLDFDVVVVDPRAAFLGGDRFPDTTVVHAWPELALLEELGLDEHACLVVLAHDPKIDEPPLEAALRAGASYVGALGGRASHAARVARLRERGLSAEQCERIHAPIGLDIGARTPAEIALAISAELVAVRRARR